MTPGTARPSTVDDEVKTLMCGCLHEDYHRDGHRPGCWMDAAEAIATEAYTAPGDTPPLAGMLAALVESGHLREPDSEGELFSLLDALAEAGLLGRAAREHAEPGG